MFKTAGLRLGGMLLSTVFLAGCSLGGGNAESTFTGIAPVDPGPIHVHGLGVNPSDGALFIATHTGLYRVGEGKSKATRVSDRYQDTMGFAVAGSDEFLGSGRPDARDLQAGTPPLLGFIRSTDAGKTWEPVSLLGKADFHVLRFAGERVYGYDASGERLLASQNGGRTWAEREAPGALIDLAANPSRPGRLLASGTDRLYVSMDDGRSWQPLNVAPGLLAWPVGHAIYRVEGDGSVSKSGDGGKSWLRVGDLGGEPAALLATSETEVYAALHDGTIKKSIDDGVTWTVRSSP
ncbi:MAG: F510_1955 family glycosylhydrolase [Gaiellaceae bacterium]